MKSVNRISMTNIVQNQLDRPRTESFLRDLAEKQSRLLESYGFRQHIHYMELRKFLKEETHLSSSFKWETGSLKEFLPWARERFISNKARMRGRQLVSCTNTSGRRIVRGFIRSFTKSEFEAYETPGRKSCPIEAVWLPAVVAGYPALPAYPFVLALDKTNKDHIKGLDAVSALIDAGFVTKEAAGNVDWFRGEEV